VIKQSQARCENLEVIKQSQARYENSELFKPRSIVTSGTVVKVRNSEDLIGFVDSVTPAQLQNCILNSIISVQGF
jgi:hypothetical protein